MPLDPQLVANHLGLSAVDDRLTLATAAAEAWAQKRRSTTDPTNLWMEQDVVQGGVIYAALLYQSRAQPEGFAGYDNLGTSEGDTGQAMANAFRLVGADPVVA